MFWNKNKINQDMIPKLRPTSKLSLKQMCLISSNGDLEKAGKLYDFMIKDMDDLPLFDPIKPNIMQQIKDGVNGSFQWFNENQNQIFMLIDMIKSKFSKGHNIPNHITNPIPDINRHE